MKTNHLLSTICLAAVAGMTAFAVSSTAHGQDGAAMVRFEDSQLDEVWIRAGGPDLSRYHAIHLAPVTVSYKDRRPDYVLDEHQIERLDAVAREELAQSLGSRNGYAIADAPGPGVLDIHAQFADLDINASNATGAPGSRTFVKSVGSMTLIATLRDPETGENLILVRDHVEGRDLRFGAVGPASYWFEFRDAVADWGDRLRVRLDDARLSETASAN